MAPIKSRQRSASHRIADWFLLRVSTREIFKEDEYVKTASPFHFLLHLQVLHFAGIIVTTVINVVFLTKLVIGIVWLMSSRVARDSLDPIREIEEAPLQRRRSWSRAIGRSTGIPRGSMSDHGCRLLACSPRISSIEEESDRRSNRAMKERDGVRDLRRLIRRLRSISRHPRPGVFARDKIL